MSAPFRILLVCTANICRSPAAEYLMRARLTGGLSDAISVSSAGTGAIDGMAACDLSSALVGEFVAATGGSPGQAVAERQHRARRVTPELLAQSDLVLALDRSHRADLARLAPRRRTRMFTLRQAAALAQPIGADVTAGRLPEGAPPLPDTLADRLDWFLAELDAARGQHSGEPEPGSMEWHDQDVPDPHVLGYQIHPMAIERIEVATITLCDAIAAVAGAPVARTP